MRDQSIWVAIIIGPIVMGVALLTLAWQIERNSDRALMNHAVIMKNQHDIEENQRLIRESLEIGRAHFDREEARWKGEKR